MTVIAPCQPCEGRGYIVRPEGPREDCPRCNGRGYLASTEVSAEENMDWLSTPINVCHTTGGKGERAR